MLTKKTPKKASEAILDAHEALMSNMFSLNYQYNDKFIAIIIDIIIDIDISSLSMYLSLVLLI